MIAGFGPPLLSVQRATLIRGRGTSQRKMLLSGQSAGRDTHGLITQKAKRKEVLSQLTLLSMTCKYSADDFDTGENEIHYPIFFHSNQQQSPPHGPNDASCETQTHI